MVKLSKDECNALKMLINDRVEFAILSLKDNDLRYADASLKQEENWKVADEILNRLPREDRLTVTRYYEEEVHIHGFELDASYLQGVRDCVKALMFFGIIGARKE